MFPSVVHVTAPSRLHFGMLSFGRPDVPQFGGVGAMIDAPPLRLSVRAAPSLQVVGPLAGPAERVVRRVARHLELPGEPACRVEVHAAPPQHCGLGVGTQLGLSVAAALARFFAWPGMTTKWAVDAAGRGRRSAVGSFGFFTGGLIYESGKTPAARSTLKRRVALPAAWRFVLIRPATGRGLHGQSERDAFAALPPVPPQTTRRLESITEEGLIPAAERGDFAAFSENLFDYGYTVGTCFATRQGCPYAGPRLARLVDTVRALGIHGVGQSSWGPTLFALVADDSATRQLVRQLLDRPENSDLELTITPANNSGAKIEVVSHPS